MRAVNFMKIDYIRTKQQMYFLPVFCLIALILGSRSFSPVVGFSYMAFLGMILSTAPFGTCRAKEAGFLVLLPSRARDRVLGRFLYGMSFMVFAIVLGCINFMINELSGRKIEAWMPGVSLMILAGSIFITSMEFLFLYLVGAYVAQNLLSIVRILPGMVIFFLSMNAFENLEDGEAVFSKLDVSVLDGMSRTMMQAGTIAMAVSLVILAVVIVVCVKVVEKRDYM